MAGTVIRTTEELARKGKQLAEAEEVIDLLRKHAERG
jgi:hypothetical protein